MSNFPGTLLGYATTGAVVGGGLTAAVNAVPTTTKDTQSDHNGLIGDNWGFIKTGAGIGGAIALASAGISLAARKPRLSSEANATSKKMFESFSSVANKK